MSDPTITRLEQASATFQATRSAYPSSSDLAQAELLLLAQEVIALRQVQAANGAGVFPATGATTHLATYPDTAENVLAHLADQIGMLQESQQAQQAEIAQLRAQLANLPTSRADVLRRPIPQSPPHQIRPIEYWAAHVPDYGDSLSRSEIDAFLARPRVRPEDLPIELAREARPNRRGRVFSPAAWQSLSAAGPAVALFLLIVAAVLIFALLSVLGR